MVTPLPDALAPRRGGIGTIFVVDDQRSGSGLASELDGGATALRGAGHGPAAARNVGWRASRAE